MSRRDGGAVGPLKDKSGARSKRPVSLTSLATRMSALEAQQTALVPSSALISPGLGAVDGVTPSHLAELLEAQHAKFSEQLQAYGHRVKVTLAGMQQQHDEETQAAGRAAAEGASSTATALRELHERQRLLEERLAALMQDQALRTARPGRGSAASSAQLPDERAPANAAAAAAADAAKKALDAAEAAELAASASNRSLEAVVAKQQQALEQAEAREKRLHARIDALSDALAEQGRAHAEATKHFGATFVCLAGGCMPPEVRLECKAYGAVFMITSIGQQHKGGSKTGFTLTKPEIEAWMRADPVCQTHARRYKFVDMTDPMCPRWPKGVHRVPPPSGVANPWSQLKHPPRPELAPAPSWWQSLWRRGPPPKTAAAATSVEAAGCVA